MVTWGPTKNLGPIGSAVLTFIGYKQTDNQTNKQTDKPNLYIEAYDCIDYKIPLKRLENAGIRGNTLLWFESYLRGRGKKVDINGPFSDFFQILEMCLVQGSRIVYCLLAMWMIFFHSNTLSSVAFANDTNVASKCKRLNTPADTINKESENNLLVHV